jgi:hypothetical protein
MKTMKKLATACLIAAGTMTMNAQNVGISAVGIVPNGGAGLDVNFSDKGMLIPRVSLSNVSTYSPPITGGGPAKSMLVYNTNTAVVGGNGEGFYYWDSVATKWKYIAAPANGPGSTGQVLTSQGPNNPPQWSTLSVSTTGGGTEPTHNCSYPYNCPTMWSNYSSTTMNWGDCVRYCDALVEGGFSDWHIPSFYEVWNMFITNPTSAGTSSNYFWTSTPSFWYNLGGSTTNTGTYYRWRPSDGDWTWPNANTFTSYCRCVR